MDAHPLITHQVAQARNEERVARGLAAYNALRAGDEQAPQQAAAGTALRAGRLLDRLVRRDRTGERAGAAGGLSR